MCRERAEMLQKACMEHAGSMHKTGFATGRAPFPTLLRASRPKFDRGPGARGFINLHQTVNYNGLFPPRVRPRRTIDFAPTFCPTAPEARRPLLTLCSLSTIRPIRRLTVYLSASRTAPQLGNPSIQLSSIR